MSPTPRAITPGNSPIAFSPNSYCINPQHRSSRAIFAHQDVLLTAFRDQNPQPCVESCAPEPWPATPLAEIVK